MEKFDTKDGKVIQYEDGQATVIDPKELEAQKEEIEKRLVINPEPSKEELLGWARANYPYVDHSAEKKELDRISNVLEDIKHI
jgi:hypothetical protein